MLTAARTWFNSLQLNTQLMILITGLNLVDFLTTKFLVDRFGYEVEANPLQYNTMVLLDSVYALLYVKIVVLAFLWWIYDKVEHHHTLLNPQRMTYALSTLVVGFFALVTWNFYVCGKVLLTSLPI